jgi:hypothetical protein
MQQLYRTKSETKDRIHSILKKNSVLGMISYEIREVVKEKKIRAYGNRPQRIEKKISVIISAKINQEKNNAAIESRGWRAYITNRSEELLSTEGCSRKS